MKKENIPFLILIASVILFILNISTLDVYDLGFWFRIIGNGFVILAVIKIIKNQKV